MATRTMVILLMGIALASVGLPAAAQESVYDQAVAADTAEDYATARRLHKQSCDADFALSCREYVAFLYNGRGGPEDLVEARKIALKACRLGSTDACGMVAQFSYSGTGGPKDYATIRLLGEAMCGEESKAARLCLFYGVAMKEGLGGDPDRAKAEQALLIPCRGSRPLACLELARIYLGDMGEPIDRDRGIELIAHSCYRQLEQACAALGVDAATFRQQLDETCREGDQMSCRAIAKP